MATKKELKMQFKQMKSQMGIYMIRSKMNNKCYINATQNLNGRINSGKFKLRSGNHPCRELQNEWKEYGEENFIIETLEVLPYDKDESKTDYSEDLILLQLIWEEKLLKRKLSFYKN
ncbi:MAG: GIY-YIG nuclease family protein [Eubacteriales bacterium]